MTGIVTLDTEAFGIFSAIDDHLGSIAASLAVIAGDITERKERETASLRSQLAHLRMEVQRTEGVFGSADKAMARKQFASDSDREWHRRTEREMEQAHAALNAFEAAHPAFRDTVLV